jgi:hypothetical protein
MPVYFYTSMLSRVKAAIGHYVHDKEIKMMLICWSNLQNCLQDLVHVLTALAANHRTDEDGKTIDKLCVCEGFPSCPAREWRSSLQSADTCTSFSLQTVCIVNSVQQSFASEFRIT